MPIHMLIREKINGNVVIDKLVYSLDKAGYAGSHTSRSISLPSLTRGKYIAEIKNMERQADLEDVKITVGMFSGDVK